MTPAINQLKAAKIPHQLHKYQVAENSEGYGISAAKALRVDPGQLFKTLMVSNDAEPGILAVAIVPVSHQLSLKLTASALGWKKASMADPVKAQKSSGYVLGGISPLGQKTRLPTVLDLTALEFDQIYVSAGRRGIQVSLKPLDLTGLLSAIHCSITDALP